MNIVLKVDPRGVLRWLFLQYKQTVGCRDVAISKFYLLSIASELFREVSWCSKSPSAVRLRSTAWGWNRNKNQKKCQEKQFDSKEIKKHELWYKKWNYRKWLTVLKGASVPRQKLGVVWSVSRWKHLLTYRDNPAPFQVGREAESPQKIKSVSRWCFKSFA